MAAVREAHDAARRVEDVARDVTIYLAAPFELISVMGVLAADLTRAGFTIRASWLLADPDDLDLYAADALRDLTDIDAADIVVVANPPEYYRSGSGGRHVEMGYALALGKPVVLWGHPSNVFHLLPDVRVVTDRQALPDALLAIGEELDMRIVM